MPAREPWWWYPDDGGMTWPARALLPVASVWGWIARLRIERGIGHQSPLPVVCIGNFTAGGTGKTPLAVALAHVLKERGCTPVFLTRGYGRRRGGVHFVDPREDSAEDVGDEPLILADAAPVAVARDRAAGAEAIRDRFGHAPGALILMDDGLQNPTLAKDVAIAVVDGRRGLGNGCVIPAGPLRAPLEFQLGLVSAIVLNGRMSGAGRRRTVLPDAARRIPSFHVRAAPAASTAWLEGRRVLAFSGIGNPSRFFELLAGAGAKVIARKEFADHHPYSEAEAGALLRDAERLDLQLVTTEKDWVRLQGHEGARAALRSAARPLRIVLEFEGGIEPLVELILERIAARLSPPPP